MRFIKGSIIRFGESVSVGQGLGLSETSTGLVELITSGSVGGATTLNDLTDVTITAAATADYLRYNGTQWVDVPLQAGDIPTHTHVAGDIASGTFPSGRYTFLTGPVIIGTDLGGSDSLRVSGSASVVGNISVIFSTDPLINIQATSGSGRTYRIISRSSDGAFVFRDNTAGADRAYFTSGGNLIIGTDPTGSEIVRIGGGVHIGGQTGNYNLRITGGTNPNVAVMSGTLSGKLQALGAAGGPVIYLGAESNHAVKLITNNTARWNVLTTGHLVAETDNTYDMGAAGDTRARVLYLASGIIMGPIITDPNPEVKSLIKGSNAGFLFKATNVPNYAYGTVYGVNTYAGFSALAEGAGGSAEVDIEYTGTDDVSPVLYFSRARGTYVSPAFTAENDLLGRTDYIAYKGSGVLPHNRAVGASEVVRADGTWSATSYPTRFEWWTTVSGSVTPAQRMSLNSSGTWSVGDTNTYVKVVKDSTLGTYRLELFSKDGVYWPYIVAESEGTGGAEIATGSFSNDPDGSGYYTAGHYRGTRANPQYILANDALGIHLYRSYKGSGAYPNIFHDAARHDVTAPSGWTDLSRPTQFSWYTTASGTTVTNMVMRLDQNLRIYNALIIPNSSTGSLWGRNAADSANLNLFGLDAGNNLNIGRDDAIGTIQLFGDTVFYDDAATPIDRFSMLGNGVMLIGKDLGGSRTLRVSGSVQIGSIQYAPSTVVYPLAMRGRYYSESDNSGGAGGIAFRAPTGGANAKMWDFLGQNDNYFLGRVLADDESSATHWLELLRSGMSITSIAFPNGKVVIGSDIGTSSRLLVSGGATFTPDTSTSFNITLRNAPADKNWGLSSFTDGLLYFGRNDASNRMVLSTAALYPGSAGLLTLGTVSIGWGDLYLNTIGKFKATPTGTLRTDDVWSYNGTEWTNRMLQFSFATGQVVATSLPDGTAASLVNTNPTLSGAPGGTPSAPTTIATYRSIIVTMPTALPNGNTIYVLDYSTNAGAYTTNAILSTSNKIVHSNLDPANTYAYKYLIRGSTDTAYSTASSAINPSSVSEANAFGLIVASQISTVNLSALTANMGTLTAGVIQDTAEKFKIDLNNRLITMKDEQTVPVTRIRLGELDTGPEDWGLEIKDSANRTVLNADGLGLEARIFGQNRQLSQVMTFLVPNAEFDLWDSGTILHWNVDTTGGATYAKETSVVWSGDYSFKYTNPDNATNGGWHGMSSSDAFKGAFCVPVKPGVTYQIRVASRINQIGAGQGYRIKLVHSNDETLTSIKTFQYNAQDTWQNDVWAVTIPSGALPNSKIYVEFNRSSDATTTDFYIDSVRVVEIEEAQFYENLMSGVAVTVDWAQGPTQKILLTATTTLTFINGRPGQTYILEIQQDGTGSRTITHDTNVYWPSDTAPTLTTTPYKLDILAFECVYLSGGIQVVYMGRSLATNYTQNDVKAFTGNFNWSSGLTAGSDIIVSGIPFRPKLVLFWSAGRPEVGTDAAGSSDAHTMFGAAVPGNQFAISGRQADNVASTQADRTSSNASCVIEMGNAAITGRLNFIAYTSDGFMLDVNDQATSTHQIMYLALGGNTFVASITQQIFPSIAGYTSATHGLGTTPSVVLMATADTNDTSGEDVPYSSTQLAVGFGINSVRTACVSVMSPDAVGTSNPRSGSYFGTTLDWQMTTGGAINNRSVLSGQAPFTSTLVKYQVLETTAEVSTFYMIAIGGCKATVLGDGIDDKTRTDITTDITLTPTTQLQPQALFMITHCSGTTSNNATHTNYQIGFGAAAKSLYGDITQQCSITAERSFTGPTNTQAMTGHYYNAIYANMNVLNDSLEGRMRTTAIGPGTSGLKFRMDDADPDRYRYSVLVIGN